MSGKSYSELTGTPMRFRSSDFIYSKEGDWKNDRKDTHVSLFDAANIIGVSRLTAEKLLPPADAQCPHGNKTRMWLRSVVEAKAKELKAEYHDGYMTREQAIELLGISAYKAGLIMPKHDKYCPFHGGKKLYKRETIEALLSTSPAK